MIPALPESEQDRPTLALWLAVAGFGALVNLLFLTGPLFMLQVYERVLPARSGPTLVVLFGLVAFLYAIMAALDMARGGVMARLAARYQAVQDPVAIAARLRASTHDPPDSRTGGGSRDVDTVVRALLSPGALAVFDAPWGVAFLGLLFLFHPALGALALGGGVVLMGLAAFGQWRLRGPAQRSEVARHGADSLADALQRDAPTLRALAMEEAGISRWLQHRSRCLHHATCGADRLAVSSALTRALRLFLQSAVLALGAWLALQGQISAGLMIAASVLLGRALAPIESLAAHWPLLRAGYLAWHRLAALPKTGRSVATGVFPASGSLTVQGLVVLGTRGAPVLNIRGFSVAPGTALGVIGPSGSGKTTLARALIGAVTVAGGTLRLGAAALPLRGEAARAIGYLPQHVQLFQASLGENIARLDPNASEDALTVAARAAGVEAMIAALPDGFAMNDLSLLSGGHVQRVGLARALFGDPHLVILDEPNAHLDAEGSAALNAAIRSLKARGAVVLVMAHRPAAIAECEALLVLENGTQVAFGPRDPVLRDAVRNHTAIVRSTGAIG